MSNKILHIIKKTFIFLLFSSCAQSYLDVTPLEPLDASPSWFKTKKRFTHYNYNNPDTKYLIHPFFDLKPYLAKKDQGVNMVVLTQVDSTYEYSINLKSGKTYKKRKYCKEKDIWESFSGSIHRPPFTIGFVPRLLDARGLPQKVITYGENRYYPQMEQNKTSSIRVRIVGGVIEQYCRQYPCTKKNRWLSRIVLIAVNPNDPKFQNIVHIQELKKVIDWTELRGFLENGSGRNIKAAKELPSYRVIGGMGSNEAITMAKNKGHLFGDKEIKSLRSSCHSLYDYLWTNSETIRKNIIKSKNHKNQDFLDATKEEFAGFFYKFTSKYKKRFMLCQRYVREASINDNIDRLWYLNYIHAFYRLTEVGDIYSCKHKSWISNPYHANGNRSYSPMKELETCSTADLNIAFYKVMTALAARQGSYQEYSRFISYDNSNGGSHQKIYSWVEDDSNFQGCAKVKNFKGRPVFPTNVDWKAF